MDIAIIGMAGRFPEAADVQAFLRNLRNGRDSVRAFSRERLRNTTVPPGADYQVAGYLDGIDAFDHDFFGISPGEARHMDPHHRLMLEVAHETFENAGYNVDDFNGTNTSVFIGNPNAIGEGNLYYYQHAEAYDPTLLTGNLNAAIAGRVARCFNLRGSASMIDTACSSSLVALHFAVNDLAAGESDCALVGGVNLNLFPALRNDRHDQLGIGSPDGRAKAFSADANGTAGGEAAGCLLLKPLAKALADGDCIHAVIKGTAVNQDAALSGSLTSPSNVAQAEVIRKAWKKAGIDPATVAYIEAHGTGTKLGDPIEVQGIDAAFRAFTDKKQFCALASVKTNIGHADSAAGIVGVIKAVLSLRYRTLFPSLHFSAPNPFIDFAHSAVYVNTGLKAWETDGNEPRRCGVSSFGLSGTNAHAVLEEAPAAPVTDPAPAPVLVLLSAKDPGALQRTRQRLHGYLAGDQEAAAPDLADVGYTLGAGRKHYPYRFAAVAASREALLAQLADPNAAPQTGAAPTTRLVLVFSGHIAVAPGLVDRLGAAYPAFRTHAEAGAACLGETGRNDNADRFILQYGFYHLLAARGIGSKVLVGDGVGNIVIAVVTGKMTLEEGMQAAAAYVPKPDDQLDQRCAGLLGKLGADPLVFAEMGAAGNIGQGLRARRGEGAHYALVHLDAAETDPLLAYARDLYLAGYAADWAAFYGGSGGRRTSLPAYPFAKTRCWVKEPAPEEAAGEAAAPDVAGWFYGLHWQESPAPAAPLPADGVWLVASPADPQDGLAAAVTARLEAAGNHCITITLADAYRAVSPAQYTIDHRNEEDYARLAGHLQAQHPRPAGLVLLTPDPVAAEADLQREYREAGLEEALYGQAYAPFLLLRAFHAQLTRKDFRVGLLTRGAAAVTPGETPRVLSSLPVALLKSILSDYPQLPVSSVDVSPSATPAASAACLLGELAGRAPVRFAAYRGDTRYTQRLAPLPPQPAPAPFRTHGVYLVTGGTGGIGLEVCKYLAGHYQGTLLVLATQPLPEKNEWAALSPGHPARERVQALQQLEALGGRVEYYAADVADAPALAAAFARIGARYAALDGVIHAAGLAGDWQPIAAKSLASFRQTLRPKLHGSLLLEQYSRALSPGFFVAFSSLNALMPQKHSADYAVANAFQDAFCTARAGQGSPFRSLAWPGWGRVGMAARSLGTQAHDPAHAAKLIAPEDGIRAFAYGLGLAPPHLAVVHLDLGHLAVNPFFSVVLPAAEGPAATSARPAAAGPSAAEVKARSREALTDTQAQVMAIWQEVLKRENLLLADDFFALGGHSLNGTQVVNRIEKAFGVSLTFDDLLDYGTVAQLAAHLDALCGDGETRAYQAIAPVDTQPDYPVSHGQKRLWISDQLQPGNVAYNLPCAFRIEKALDRAAFERAFQALVARHESLRTVFTHAEGQPRQTIRPAGQSGFRVDFVDLQADPEGEEKARQAAQAEAAAPFDLAAGPLLRAKLIRVAGEAYVFLFTMHHIIADGWSMGVLLREVLALYEAFGRGEESPLPPLPIQYKDYAAWQHAQLAGAQANAHEQYWLAQFAGEVPPLDLPADHPRPAVKTHRGDHLPFRLDPALAARLGAFGQQRGASLFMTLLASVYALLYRYTGQRDLVVGSPIAGRDHADLENQIGLYVNLLALRVRCDAGETFETLLQKVKTVALGAYQHQVYPFDLLVEKLDAGYDPGRSPLTDVWVQLRDGSEPRYREWVGSTLHADAGQSKVDLSFEFVNDGDALNAYLHYNTDLFERATIEAMQANLLHLLGAVLAEPAAALAGLELRVTREEESETNRFLQSMFDLC